MSSSHNLLAIQTEYYKWNCRGDDLDVIEMAKKDYGWRSIESRKEFDDLQQGWRSGQTTIDGSLRRL